MPFDPISDYFFEFNSLPSWLRQYSYTLLLNDTLIVYFPDILFEETMKMWISLNESAKQSCIARKFSFVFIQEIYENRSAEIFQTKI